MTYIVPDDWYANHNMAPGDARPPQPALELIRRNKPLPPIRGSFGRYIRPLPASTRTVSPFAVPDGLWVQGIMSRQAARAAGLGEEAKPLPAASHEQTLQELLERTSKELKRQIIETSVAQAATSLTVSIVIASISWVPVVGWIIAIVWAALQLVFSWSAAKYQREAERIMSDLSLELQTMGAGYQRQLDAIKLQVFDQEKAASIRLALSNESLEEPKPVQGLGADWWKKLISPVYHATKVLQVSAKPVLALVKAANQANLPGADKVLVSLNKTGALVQKLQNKDLDIYSGASGESVRNIARQKAGEARILARAEFEEQFKNAKIFFNSAEYRSALRRNTAQYIRDQPFMSELITNARGAAAQNVVVQMVNTGVIPQQEVAAAAYAAAVKEDQRNQAATILPAVGAMAAVLLIGSLKS